MSRNILQLLGDCLHNVFGSGILAMAGAVLVMASLDSIVSCLLPFWFTLTLYNQKFGDEVEPNNITIDTGLYFMDKDKFINLLMIDKASSVNLMPVFLRYGQLWYLIGTIGIITCTASTILLMIRSKVVVSAEIALTGATIASALSQILGVFLCVIQVSVDDRAKWQDLPVKDAIPNRFGYYKILEAYPEVSLNWGFYFAVISGAFSLVGAVVCCVRMVMSCSSIKELRYQMLRQRQDEGTSPIPGFPYYANKGYNRHPGVLMLPGQETRPLIYTDRPPAATEVDL